MEPKILHFNQPPMWLYYKRSNDHSLRQFQVAQYCPGVSSGYLLRPFQGQWKEHVLWAFSYPTLSYFKCVKTRFHGSGLNSFGALLYFCHRALLSQCLLHPQSWPLPHGFNILTYLSLCWASFYAIHNILYMVIYLCLFWSGLFILLFPLPPAQSFT
jgi:hypothetical protein